jgi:methionine-R-sulfoxide reductase
MKIALSSTACLLLGGALLSGVACQEPQTSESAGAVAQEPDVSGTGTPSSGTFVADGDWRSPDWQKPSDDVLRAKLTPLQFEVTQEEATERAFSNEFWDNKQEGIYVDIVSGEPLFDSRDKFKSGTGWPSFVRPIAEERLASHEDNKLFMSRTEVRSAKAGSHLGHVFEDGPAPTGLRYCINSASLRFVPKGQLKVEGYGEFAKSFEAEKP